MKDGMKKCLNVVWASYEKVQVTPAQTALITTLKVLLMLVIGNCCWIMARYMTESSDSSASPSSKLHPKNCAINNVSKSKLPILQEGFLLKEFLLIAWCECCSLHWRPLSMFRLMRTLTSPKRPQIWEQAEVFTHQPAFWTFFNHFDQLKSWTIVVTVDF